MNPDRPLAGNSSPIPSTLCGMKRPSKKEIQEAIRKLHEEKPNEAKNEPHVPKPSGKKPNKNRIRKQGV